MIVNEHFVSGRVLCSYTLIYCLKTTRFIEIQSEHDAMPIETLAPEYDEDLLYLLQSTVRN